MRIGYVVLAIVGICTLAIPDFVQAIQSSRHKDRTAATITSDSSKKSSENYQVNALFIDDELVFPSLDSHRTALLSVGGKGVQWARTFENGTEPFFNAEDEGFEPGIYAFRIEYKSNKIAQAKERRTNSITTRRSLLKKRLELMRAGDRSGAKALLKQANMIRDGLAKSEGEDASFLNGSKEDFVTKTGRFKVSEDRCISEYDLRNELKLEAEQRLRESKKKRDSIEHDANQSPRIKQ